MINRVITGELSFLVLNCLYNIIRPIHTEMDLKYCFNIVSSFLCTLIIYLLDLTISLPNILLKYKFCNNGPIIVTFDQNIDLSNTERSQDVPLFFYAKIRRWKLWCSEIMPQLLN